MANKVKFGLKNVHYCPIDDDGAYSSTVYSLPGAVSLSLDAEGDIEKFYADNFAYYQSAANNGYSGTLEVALITDEFRQNVLGETLNSTTKNLLETNSDKPKSFALGFQVDGDSTDTLYWYYNCSVTRPSTEAATIEDTKTPSSESMSISCVANSDGKVRIKSTADTPEATLTGWFTAVVTE